MNVIMRSSDTFVGLPYDVLGYALLQQAITTELNDMAMSRRETAHPVNRWTLGTLTFNLAHAHLYDSHFQATKDMLEAEHDFVEPPMPKAWSLTDIEKGPDLYVGAVRVIQKNMKQPAFDFKPEVIE
jgi:thymidylate synthase